MRNEASLRRLIEMGVDVYVPRVARDRRVALPAVASSRETPVAHVLVLARAGTAQPLIACVLGALRFARIEGRVEATAEATRIIEAAGLVVFGETLAREAGALLPANRQQEPQWVAAPDAAKIGADAAAKRALWSELRRLVRALRAGGG